MKKVSIRELHESTGKLVDLASEGHPILVLRRGVAVAELRPVTRASRARTLPDREAFLSRFPKIELDSGRILEEDRS